MTLSLIESSDSNQSIESNPSILSKSTMNFSRNIPVLAPFDLVVCGGGPSGCAAALAASRAGLSVLLAEGQSQPGGMATSGMVSHWLGGRTQLGEWVVGGLFRELAQEASECGCAVLPQLPTDSIYQPHGWLPWFIHGIPVDPFAMAVFLDKKLTSEKISLLYETDVIDTAVEHGRITHIVIQNKNGIQAVPARMVIDATGDADVAVLSGCKTVAGRDKDGLMTPASLTFHLYGVDHQTLAAEIESTRSPKFREKIESLRQKKLWPFPYDIFISVKLVQDDVAMINTMRLPGVNGLDAASRTSALIQGRQEAYALLNIFKEHFPGFERAEMKCIAPLLGIRETRRIQSEFCLRVQDLSEPKDFEDTIGFSMYGWDLPDPQKPSHQPLVDESNGKFINKTPKVLYTPVPYRIMVPHPVRNLLCPGRAISVERDVLGPLRVMAPCMAMGEACGMAAAEIVHGHATDVASVNPETLRQKLRNVSCIVDRAALPDNSPRCDP